MHTAEPLTRKESQARTREKLIRVGIAAVATEGVHALSIRKLSTAAGLTMGAFYANFASRGVFLEELCREVTREFLGSIRVATGQACRRSREEAAGVFADWSLKVEDRIALSMFEFGSLACSDEAFRSFYITLAESFRASLGAEMRRLFGAFGLRPRMSYEQMAAGFMTMWMGQLMFRYMPEREQFTGAIAAFLSDLMRTAAQEGQS